MTTQTKFPTLEERGFGDGGNGGEGSAGRSAGGNGTALSVGPTGIWIAMASITMFFAAFTSAMVVRAGLGADWTRVALPRILYLNTAMLLASSVTLELSGRSLRAAREGPFFGWLMATAALGVAFLAGQLDAWRELAARGVYLATNPACSFFYLLTAAHGAHLAGGLLALFYLVARHRRIATGANGRTLLRVTTLYWHFMDILWLYLFLMLALWV